jgi:hypothetical protein
MSTELYIADKWKELFKELKLTSYEDFFRGNDHFELVAKEKSQKIFRINSNGNIFYLKRNTPERPRKIFRQLLRGRPYVQPITKEIRNLLHLNKRNISVMKLAAWGTKTTAGYPKTSFLIAENVEGCEFMDFYNDADFKTRKRLFKSYAELVGSLHSNNLDSIPRIQDIFCQDTDESVKLTMIDREEGSTKKVHFNKETAALELAKVFYHGLKRYKQLPTAREIMIFCRGYLLINKQISMSPKEFYRYLIKSSVAYMQKRKSFHEVKTLLPDSIFN